MTSETRTTSAGKKKGGGFLARHVKANKQQTENYTSEEDLLKKDVVTPDDVLRLPRATESKWRTRDHSEYVHVLFFIGKTYISYHFEFSDFDFKKILN